MPFDERYGETVCSNGIAKALAVRQRLAVLVCGDVRRLVGRRIRSVSALYGCDYPQLARR